MSIFEKSVKMDPNKMFDVPFSGVLVSGENLLPFLGHAFARFVKCLMSLFRGFLFQKKTLLSLTTFFHFYVF